MATSAKVTRDDQCSSGMGEMSLVLFGSAVSCAVAVWLLRSVVFATPATLIIAHMTFVIGYMLKHNLKAWVNTAKTPAADTSAVDDLKARLLALVNRRDEELEDLAESNEPAEVKEEKARVLLERYNRDVAEA